MIVIAFGNLLFSTPLSLVSGAKCQCDSLYFYRLYHGLHCWKCRIHDMHVTPILFHAHDIPIHSSRARAGLSPYRVLSRQFQPCIKVTPYTTVLTDPSPVVLCTLSVHIFSHSHLHSNVVKISREIPAKISKLPSSCNAYSASTPPRPPRSPTPPSPSLRSDKATTVQGTRHSVDSVLVVCW